MTACLTMVTVTFEAENVFKPIRAFFKQRGIEAEFVPKVGSVADVIAKLVNGGSFDLVLMGTHGHGNVANAVIRSVVTKVIAACKVPVLLVRRARPLYFWLTRHRGVAALRPQGSASTHLTLMVMARTASGLARPLTALPPDGPGCRAVVVFAGPWSFRGSFPRLDRRGRPG
jgi:hypothetical protein